MKSIRSLLWISLGIVLVSFTPNTNASSDLTESLIPRQLFFPQHLIHSYPKSEPEKIKRFIANQKGWNNIKIHYQSQKQDGDFGIKCVFTYEDEAPRHLYFITPEKKIVQIDSRNTFYARYEENLGESSFLWSSYISKDDLNRQYYLFDADTLKSEALDHPQNFTRIVFDNNLNPIVGTEGYNAGKKRIYIQTDEGEWQIISDKEELQEAVLTNAQKNPYTGEAVIVEGMQSENGEFTNRLMTYHPKTGPKIIHEGVDGIGELAISVVEIVSGVPVCGYSYVKQGKIDWHLKDTIFRYVFSDFKDKIQHSLGHDSFSIAYMEQDCTDQWRAEVDLEQEPDRKALYNLDTKSLSWVPDDPFTKAIRDKKESFVPYSYAEIPSHDELIIPTFIAKPKKGSGPFPTVVLIHGGPHDRYVSHFSPFVQLLVNRGILAITPNFRGSTTSPHLMAQSQGQWGNGMQTDLHHVVEWAIDKGLSDKNKVAFWGGSYGGFSTLLEAVDPYRSSSFPGICCAIAQCAVSDLQGFIADINLEFGPRTDPTVFMLAPEMNDTCDTIPEAVMNMFNSVSPIHKAKQTQTPLLILHGDKDRRVSPAHAYKMSKVLTEKKVPHTFITFPEDVHESDDPAIKLAHFALIETFFAQHLGSNKEPFGLDLSHATMIVHQGEDLIEGLSEALRTPIQKMGLKRGLKLPPFPLEDPLLSDLVGKELFNMRTKQYAIVPTAHRYSNAESVQILLLWFLLSISGRM